MVFKNSKCIKAMTVEINIEGDTYLGSIINLINREMCYWFAYLYRLISENNGFSILEREQKLQKRHFTASKSQYLCNLLIGKSL